jgi:enamine deaminase RidA (YjgF/YER057c/UK114 family)
MNPQSTTLDASRSRAELDELEALGLLDREGRLLPVAAVSAPERGAASVARRAISNPAVLNEAHAYHPTPASFSRGLRVDLRAGSSLLYISGTASVDEHGRSVHAGDFRAQCWRTFRNITELLRSEGASWQDVVRTTCYLRDIERDYEDFNQVRNYFLRSQRLDPLPASTGIQARLCRADLLIEIEAIAILERDGARPGPRP